MKNASEDALKEQHLAGAHEGHPHADCPSCNYIFNGGLFNDRRKG